MAHRKLSRNAPCLVGAGASPLTAQIVLKFCAKIFLVRAGCGDYYLMNYHSTAASNLSTPAAPLDSQEISFMAIKSTCPECQTVYHLADQQAGKNVRCKNCQTVFTVAASSRRSSARGDGGPSSQARSKQTMIARREDLSRGGRAEEGERTGPRSSSPRSVEKKNTMLWVLGGAVGCFGLLLLASGVVITYLVMRDNPAEVVSLNAAPPPNWPPGVPPDAPPNRPLDQPRVPPPQEDDNPPVQGQVVPPADPPPAKPADPPPAKPARPERGNEERRNNGELTREARDRVKHATVYLRVKMADGTQASGSGFFGCKEARRIVLTNAHVVGMLSPESARPQSVEVVVNSGQADEWKTTATVLGVDRVSDLAVLDIGEHPPQPVPEPLTIKSARELQELDKVYIFGFPFGEQLGKEISVADTKVSSLRKNPKTGVLLRVQVGAGMNPGNSGGPVVDNSGAVVGVAVAGIPGHAINFAIPGERVYAILQGRISELIVQQPYFTADNKVMLPLLMDMIDPRNLIKEVGVEVWTGDKPADDKSGNRPPATKQPAAQDGDSPHVYYKLKYLAPEGKGRIVLPELPPGKVYWKQPKWINSKGETHWASANPMPLTSPPVYRKPVNLVLRYTQGSKRSLDLTIENIFKVSSDEDADAFRVKTTAQLTETVKSTGRSGSVLSLRYKFPPSHDILLPSGKTIPNGDLEQVKKNLPRLLISDVKLDHLGNITQQHISLDQRSMAQLGPIQPQQIELMKEFHWSVQQGLESLSVSLPSGGTIKPLEGWRAERQLPIDTPGKAQTGKLDVTFTYLGTRKRDGREEAVISMGGLVHGRDSAISGKASGRILVDLANGQTIRADATVKLQLKAAILIRPDEPPRELRVIDTMNFHLQRKRAL